MRALRRSGIKLWVLTGDKLETAISVGLSSSVLVSSMQLIVIDEHINTRDRFMERLEQIVHEFDIAHRPMTAAAAASSTPRSSLRQRALLSASPSRHVSTAGGAGAPDSGAEAGGGGGRARSASFERVFAPRSPASRSARANNGARISDVSGSHSHAAAADGGGSASAPATPPRLALVICGSTLSLALSSVAPPPSAAGGGGGGGGGAPSDSGSDPDLEYLFLTVAKACETVICYRATPLQKSTVVQGMSERSILWGDRAITLAVGDGSNDVPMIAYDLLLAACCLLLAVICCFLCCSFSLSTAHLFMCVMCDVMCDAYACIQASACGRGH